jgi:hypothetical protein
MEQPGEEKLRYDEDKAITFRRIRGNPSWEEQERAVYTTEALRREFEAHLADRDVSPPRPAD